MDEEYDPTYQYTLTDFAFYNIYDHAQIIFEICYDAMQGDKLKEKVRKIGEGMQISNFAYLGGWYAARSNFKEN